MIILGSVILLIIVSIVFIGISSRFNAYNLSQSTIVFIKTEGCLEEGLIQLKRDSSYTGDTYNVDGLNCDVTVSGAGNERSIVVNAEENDYYNNFLVDVQINPIFAILNFSY